MKKIFTIILYIIITAISLSASSFSYTHNNVVLNFRTLGTWTNGIQNVEVSGYSVGYVNGGYVEYYETIEVPWSIIANGNWYTVTAIGDEAFINSSHLKSITLPKTLVSIGNKAFMGCINLKSASLPNGVTSIGLWSFKNCENLSTINIPNSVTSIGFEAFMGCHNLTKVSIPQSVTNIEGAPFSGCYNLSQINVDENNLAYSSADGVLYNKDYTQLICFPAGLGKDGFIIPNTVSTIQTSAFENCINLSDITIPTSVTTIGGSAFYGCNKLSTITIPNSVTDIYIGAFGNCTGLETISLPNSLSFIDICAFDNCLSLKSIYYNSENPVEASLSIFSDYINPTVYIPNTSLAESRFKIRTPWSSFKKIVKYDYSSISEVLIDNTSNVETEIFNIRGVRINNTLDKLSPGLYIIKQGHYVTKVNIL